MGVNHGNALSVGPYSGALAQASVVPPEGGLHAARSITRVTFDPPDHDLLDRDDLRGGVSADALVKRLCRGNQLGARWLGAGAPANANEVEESPVGKQDVVATA
jgi:hypothetical protein